MQSQNSKFKMEFKIRNQNEKFKICTYVLTNFEFKFVISATSSLTLYYSVPMHMMRKHSAKP